MVQLGKLPVGLAVGLACLVGLSACTNAATPAPVATVEPPTTSDAVDRVKTGSQADVEDPMERVPSVDFECGQVSLLSNLEFRVSLREAQGTATPEELAREKADLRDLFARVAVGKTPVSPFLRTAKKKAEEGGDGELSEALAAARNACEANGSTVYIQAVPGEGG